MKKYVKIAALILVGFIFWEHSASFIKSRNQKHWCMKH